MKKLAILAFILASSLAAQVQLGKNVQIGAGGATTTSVTSGSGIIVTGSGSSLDPFVISLSVPSSTTLTGPVTGTGAGTIATAITATGVTPGTYNFGSQVITVSASGQITAAGNAFSASFGCTQCGTYETGNPSITSASGTISYANPSLPVSASVSDGTNTDTLSTPFNSWVLSHAYTTNICFTLTAVGNSQTVTPQQCIAFVPRTFGGVGAAGATSSVTASGNNAVLSNGATLANAGLNNQSVYGPFSPSGQKIYILMIGGSHTFKDNTTGFSFAFNAPTPVSFVNQFGATVSMFLYESTNTLTGPFSILVAS